MAEITVKTKVPLTSGKEATFTLEDGEVAMSLPVSWKAPTFTLTDLRVALEELEAAQAANAPISLGEPGLHEIKPGEEMEALRRLLRSAAAENTPITVVEGEGLGTTKFKVAWPAPERLVTLRPELRDHPNAHVVTAGCEDLVTVVREEAEAAGVRVIG